MISKFFIDRPVFASVLSIVIVLAGLVAMRALPISQYPQIVPPEVVVSATYPGATAENIAATVAAPLEQQINGVERMIYMQSTSTGSGTMSLTVTFEIGTNPDQNAINVNNRVQRALPLLPGEVSRQGLVVQKRSTSILQVITMSSPEGRYDTIYISNYALVNVLDELRRLPGVGDAALFGASDYSMRIWLRPDKLAQYNLTPADIAAVVREQNQQFAAGRFGEEPMNRPQVFTYSVTTPPRLVDRTQFEDIIIRSEENGGALRLKDVARVELGALLYGFSGTFNGSPAVPIAVYLQPGANAIQVAATVRAAMERISKRFPVGLRYDIPFDTTRFVEVSIEEVAITFVEAIALVVLVVFLFLQSVRAMIIPVIAIPVSIIGTFAGMYVLGFSINLLTLFGLVLAIGIVVDDAIVVLENVERIMSSEGKGAARGRHPGHAGGDRPGHRHRPGAVRGVHPGVVPGRPGGRALPAVRRHHRRLGGDLGHRGADADAGAGGAAAEARARPAVAAVRLVQPLLRLADGALHRRRGLPAAPHGAGLHRLRPRAGRGVRPVPAHSRAAWCRPRTRATCSW